MNAASGADYRSGGAAWNFPAGAAGKLTLRFRLPAGSSGAHISLMDRLHAACDRAAPQAAQFTQRFVPGGHNGSLRTDTDHELALEWTGVARGATCRQDGL